jgi:hypothetical protein
MGTAVAENLDLTAQLPDFWRWQFDRGDNPFVLVAGHGLRIGSPVCAWRIG